MPEMGSESPLKPLYRLLHPRTLRARMGAYFALLVLLPAAATAAVSFAEGWRAGREQVEQRLGLVATLQERNVRTWLDSLQKDLSGLPAERGLAKAIELALQTDEALRRYTVPTLEGLFREHLQRTGQLEHLALLDLQGQTVATTDASQVGTVHSDALYFQQGLRGLYVDPPLYSDSLERVVAVVVGPVLDAQEQVAGILVGYARPETLDGLLQQRDGLGETGEAFLLDANYARLTAARFAPAPLHVPTDGARAAVGARRSGSGSYQSYWGGQVTAVYRWLPDLQIALLVEQGEAEAFAAIYRALGINLLVALAAVLAAIGASFLVARSISAPMSRLTEAATGIAGGDLERPIPADGDDEIGAMARAFGTMTGQLRGLISSLEERVEARTVELGRALQELRQEAEARENLLRTVRAMSSPVIPVTSGIMVMPLVGVLDSERAHLVVEGLLAAVEREHAEVMILDVTGLALVDTAVAQALVRATQAVRLLGAEPILVGIAPEVAATLVHLGVDLSQVRTAASLQQGLDQALRLRRR